jgi:aminoglycoside phosphotransferase (APT) family kinase protein
MDLAIDGARAVRRGEQLENDRLLAYLTAQLPGSSGALEVEQFPHGYSNLTYLLRLGGGGRELVLRRPPFGNQVKSAHDMSREFHVLDKLCRVFPPAPEPLLYCGDESVLGVPFYVMERRRGVILRGSVDLSREALRAVSEALVDTLARLHSVDVNAAGLGGFGKPEGYVERQVTGWAKRYRDAMTEEVPDLDRVADWLAANRPADSGTALIHNDFKFDNLLLDPNDLSHVVAVLDWEMATIGDPLMDLGTTLGYWVEADDPKPLQSFVVGPTNRPGSLTRREVVERYEQASRRTVERVLFYYVYGLFKIAVIAQQIYARFVRGATADPRFASLGAVVSALGRGAVLAIERGSV